jgi:thiol-disulfide isomerase/thioredoxin
MKLLTAFVLGGLLIVSSGMSAVQAADEPAVTLSAIDPAKLEKAIAEHKGKVVLVDFWATWCIPCVKKLPHIVELQNQYGERGLVVLTVSMDETDEGARASVQETLEKAKATKTRNFLNTDADWGYGIDGDSLPHYRLYGRDGKLITKFWFDPDAKAPSPDALDEKLSEVFGG